MDKLALSAALCLIVALGCDDEPRATKPVDGFYTVLIDGVADDVAATDSMLEVIWRDDGRVDVHHLSFVIPWPMRIEALEIDDANGVSWRDEHGNWFEGIILPDRIELRGNSHGRDERGESPVTVAGPARPLTDPTAIDGHYNLNVTSYVRDTATVADSWTNVGSLRQTADGQYLLGAYEHFAAYVPAFTPDEPFDWQGVVYMYSTWGYFAVEARLRGRFGPAGVDMILEVSEVDPDDQLMHVYRFDVSGVRRRPSLTSVTNDWRAEIDAREGCGLAEPKSYSYWHSFQVTEMAEGRLLLGGNERYGMVLTPRDRGTWRYVDGSPESGYTNDMIITVSPPDLTMQYVFRMYDESGAVTCEDSYETYQAVPRYVF